MTKRDLSRRVAFESNARPELAAQVVQRILDLIADALATDGGIELRDFGVFDVVMSKERIARNPRTGAPVLAPPKPRVRFWAGKEVRDGVNQSIGRLPAALAVKQ